MQDDQRREQDAPVTYVSSVPPGILGSLPPGAPLPFVTAPRSEEIGAATSAQLKGFQAEYGGKQEQAGATGTTYIGSQDVSVANVDYLERRLAEAQALLEERFEDRLNDVAQNSMPQEITALRRDLLEERLQRQVSGAALSAGLRAVQEVGAGLGASDIEADLSLRDKVERAVAEARTRFVAEWHEQYSPEHGGRGGADPPQMDIAAEAAVGIGLKMELLRMRIEKRLDAVEARVQGLAAAGQSTPPDSGSSLPDGNKRQVVPEEFSARVRRLESSEEQQRTEVDTLRHLVQMVEARLEASQVRLEALLSMRFSMGLAGMADVQRGVLGELRAHGAHVAGSEAATDEPPGVLDAGAPVHASEDGGERGDGVNLQRMGEAVSQIQVTIANLIGANGEVELRLAGLEDGASSQRERLASMQEKVNSMLTKIDVALGGWTAEDGKPPTPGLEVQGPTKLLGFGRPLQVMESSQKQPFGPASISVQVRSGPMPSTPVGTPPDSSQNLAVRQEHPGPHMTARPPSPSTKIAPVVQAQFLSTGLRSPTTTHQQVVQAGQARAPTPPPSGQCLAPPLSTSSSAPYSPLQAPARAASPQPRLGVPQPQAVPSGSGAPPRVTQATTIPPQPPSPATAQPRVVHGAPLPQQSGSPVPSGPPVATHPARRLQ